MLNYNLDEKNKRSKVNETLYCSGFMQGMTDCMERKV